MSDGETDAHRRAYETGRYSCGCYWRSAAGSSSRERHFCDKHQGNRVLGPRPARRSAAEPSADGRTVEVQVGDETVTLRGDNRGWYVPWKDSEPLREPFLLGEIVHVGGGRALLTDGYAVEDEFGDYRFYVRWRHLSS